MKVNRNANCISGNTKYKCTAGKYILYIYTLVTSSAYDCEVFERKIY